MQMNRLLQYTNMFHKHTETAAAAQSHMNTVMCTLNHAQDKQTQLLAVL